MTAHELIIAPEAIQDLAESHSWYERQRKGLGYEFLNCIEACLATMTRSPESFSIVHENYRRALVRRFPYAIFYEIVEDRINVYGVFHTARNPKKVATTSTLNSV